MPKKTKRQKQHADKVRKPTVGTVLAPDVPLSNTHTPNTPTLFSFTRSSDRQVARIGVANIDQTELNAIRKDLTKTLILAGTILSIELILAFYLR